MPSALELYRNRTVAAKRGAGRIGAMGRIGDDDFGAELAFLFEPGVDHQHPGQFPVSPCRRLKRNRIHAGNFSQKPLQIRHQLQRALTERCPAAGDGRR